MIPYKPYIHTLLLTKQARTFSWVSPAELKADAPQDVGFAAPVDSRGRFNEVYTMEVFRYGRNSKLIETEKCDLFLTAKDTLEMMVAAHRLVFREKRQSARQRSFPYLGRYHHPDFNCRLVEIEAEPVDLIDELFLCNGLVLIGCDPSCHYEGWTERQEFEPKKSYADRF